MKANEFNKTLTNGLNNVVAEVGNVEGLAKDFRKYGIKDVFTYGAWCEHNFEKNLREDYERKTTFTSDLSIAEWCVPIEGIKAVVDTINDAAKSRRDDIEYFAELIIAVNMKAWEHNARGNAKWAEFYSKAYYVIMPLYFDWYDENHENHGEAMEYYYNYVD